MKLTPTAATLYAMNWGRHISVAPAIAALQQTAIQEHVQLRKKQKQFRTGKSQSQAKEL